MPPGPPGLPIIGNAHQLAIDRPWNRLTEWREQYGPVFSLDLAGQPTVVLNSFSVVADLTDRRSSLYSDRPRLIMAGEIMTRGMMLALTRYNSLWRTMRKAIHEDFNPHAIVKYQSLHEAHAYKLLASILDLKTHNEWEHTINVSLASTLISLIYGFSSKEAFQRHEIVCYIDDFVDRLAVAARPGSYLVDLFPIMMYLPSWLAPWKKAGEESYRKDTQFFLSLLREARDRTAAGQSGDSFCSGLSEMEKRGELDEVQCAWLAGFMYMAGLETTSTALSIFVLAMVLHPDVLQRAQEEVDHVIGRDRLPILADQETLPYVWAIIQEVLRWRPAAPLSLSKRCTQDNWYKGYLIPEGTTIIENVWAMNHDPEYFEDPEAFRPERHLDAEGRLAEPIPDTHGLSHGSFGSGRRICAGKDFAMQSLFINIAVFLWGMDISNAADECGKPIVPSSSDMVDRGIAVRPRSFPCSFRPRFADARSMVDNVTEE